MPFINTISSTQKFRPTYSLSLTTLDLPTTLLQVQCFLTFHPTETSRTSPFLATLLTPPQQLFYCVLQSSPSADVSSCSVENSSCSTLQIADCPVSVPGPLYSLSLPSAEYPWPADFHEVVHDIISSTGSTVCPCLQPNIVYPQIFLFLNFYFISRYTLELLDLACLG